jgi:hypothetical protein
VQCYSHFEVIIGLKLHIPYELGLLLADRAREQVLPEGVHIGDKGQILCTLEAEGVHAAELHWLSGYFDALVADEDLFHLI